MPVCASHVADLARTAPASDEATLERASPVPLRGPDALYTQVGRDTPATVVAREGAIVGVGVRGMMDDEIRQKHGRPRISASVDLRAASPPHLREIFWRGAAGSLFSARERD